MQPGTIVGMFVARVNTNRLVVREFQLDDATDLAHVEGTSEMVAYQHHQPFTVETASSYVADAIAARTEDPRKWIELAVCNREGRFVGRIGCSLDRREAWIWYAIGTQFQGQGFATEAVSVLLDLLKEHGVESVQLECDPRNLASWRLAERLGFKLIEHKERAVEVKGEMCGSKVYAKRL